MPTEKLPALAFQTLMTYSPHCSPYISCLTDKENLFSNRHFFHLLLGLSFKERE